MATTIPERPTVGEDSERRSGNGNWGSAVPPSLVPGGNLRVGLDYSPPPSATGMWVVLFAITMMFAAFTSALVVRKGSWLDWQGFALPSILYFNTLVIIASSFTLEVSRRRLDASLAGTVANAARWLYGTLLLGLLFVGGQYYAWLRLRAEGLYLATNPSSSFYYLLTAAHALHVLGGLAGLLYIIGKLNKSALRRNQMTAMARYWHFIGILWVYLLLLLWIEM